MKKLLFVLVLTFFCISMQAQLQRNILGAKLGMSTKAYVRSVMAQKGYKAKVGDTNDTYIFENVKFAGRKCDVARFDFFQGKLLSVTFIIAMSFTPEMPESEFTSLKVLMDDKYSEYKIEDKGTECSYMDDKTYIVLSVWDNIAYFAGLCYIDNELNAQKNKSASDDL